MGSLAVVSGFNKCLLLLVLMVRPRPDKVTTELLKSFWIFPDKVLLIFCAGGELVQRDASSTSGVMEASPN